MPKKEGGIFDSSQIGGKIAKVKCNSAGGSVLPSVTLTKSLMSPSAQRMGFSTGGHIYTPSSIPPTHGQGIETN